MATPHLGIDRARTLPKIELHVHLDGSFDTKLMYETALRRMADGSLDKDVAAKVAACADVQAFHNIVTCQSGDRSLMAMLERFFVFLPIVSGELATLEELAARFVAAQTAQNVLHTELRYSPHVLARDDTGGAKAVVEAVTRGLRRACAAHPGTGVTQILCLIDGRPEFAAELLEIASAHHSDGAACTVVALDIAAGESHFTDDIAQEAGGSADDAQLVEQVRGRASANCIGTSGPDNGSVHRAAVRCAARAGLPLTIHAGESGPADNVRASASDAYGGARRVGHGYDAVSVALAKARSRDARGVADALGALGIPAGMTFEVCPTSSRATGAAGAGMVEWREHPGAVLHRLSRAAEGDAETLARLPRVTVSSDDPAVFSTTISDELAIVADGMGLGAEGVRELQLNAIEAAFLPDAARAELRGRFDAAWAAWQQAGALP
jgi:adenosine deaminase